MPRNLSYGMYMACIRYMAAPLFSEPRGSPTGGESATAAPCVEGRPTGVGFGSPFATAASEAALAARCTALPDFTLYFRPT